MKKFLLWLACFFACIFPMQAQTLYGLTFNGGQDNGGALIKFMPATNNLTVAKSFELYAANPYATNFIQATDGKLYGMTTCGGNGSPIGGAVALGPASGFGNHTYGIIFSFDPSTSTYKMLHAFDYTNGAQPLGSLVQAADGKLYGMTSAGGSSGYGVIFSFDPSTSTYTKLKDFDGANGRYPFGSLVQAADGKLYGMTSTGGSYGNDYGDYGYGVIFSFDPSTSTYTKLKDFDFTNGAHPIGSLMQASNGRIYGMTERGGSNDGGVIFSFDPSTSTYTKLKEFPYDIDGRWPRGSLIQANDGKLYGMTKVGGSYAVGVIFSFDPSTSTYTRLKDYDGINGTLNGSFMQASNGKLYAMTQNGENYSGGVIFSFDPSTLTYTKLKDFDSGTWNGLSPRGDGSLMQANNGKLYGMTCFGGNSNRSNLAVGGGSTGNGVIFSFDPSSAAYTKLMNLDSNSSGTWPSGTVMQAINGKLYGMAPRGGSKGWGVIFSFDPCNSTYTKLIDFDGITGGEPYSCLVQGSNGKLYGITNTGGSYGYGVIFSLDPSTSTYTKLIDFDGTNGYGSLGSLMQASDGKFYFIGFGAAASMFSFDPITSTITQILFGSTSASNPQGTLIQASDGKLYGMAILNIDNNEGVIFSFDPSTSAYTNLYDFHGVNGRHPHGSLMQASNGKLYGMTNAGGSYDNGVIFSFDLSTSVYTKLKDFDGTNGGNPNGNLMQASDGKLYGMTGGGENSGVSVIFSFDPSTSTYTKLQDLVTAHGDYFGYGAAFIEGANSGGNCTLPVTLLSFTGKNNGNNNQLNWIVENEFDLHYYELQRGIDGQHFTGIAQILAFGNKSYTYDDAVSTKVSSTYYYRLKIVNKNGSFTYSSICSFIFKATNKNIWISPNPVTRSIRLETSSGGLLAGNSATAIIRIYSSSMQLLQSKSISIADGSTISIPVEKLASGIYFLQLVYRNETTVSKFVKE